MGRDPVLPLLSTSPPAWADNTPKRALTTRSERGLKRLHTVAHHEDGEIGMSC